MTPPQIVLHTLPPSPPCLTVVAALELKGLEYETIALPSGKHTEEIERIYGSGLTTVPGMLVDGEPVHSSTAILERLEQLVAEPALYPEPLATEIREAELWGDREFQDLARHLPWGALHFRPESMGTFGGGGALDAPGTDFAMKYIRATWKYHKLSAVILHEDLAGLPAKLAHIESLAERGVIGNDAANAADLQIGASARVMLTVGDVHGLFDGTAAERIARRWFPDYLGLVPVGAFPAGWVPAPA